MQNITLMPTPNNRQYLIEYDDILNICSPSLIAQIRPTKQIMKVNDEDYIEWALPVIPSAIRQIIYLRGIQMTRPAIRNITRSYSSAIGYYFTCLYSSCNIFIYIYSYYAPYFLLTLLLFPHLVFLFVLSKPPSPSPCSFDFFICACSSGGKNKIDPLQKNRKLGYFNLIRCKIAIIISNKNESSINIISICC